MKKHRINTFLLCVCALVLSAHAQSLLSLRYPFGLPVHATSGMGLSMGGTAAGVADDRHVLLANPANLGATDKTAFSSLLSIFVTHSVDGNNTRDQLSVKPSVLTFAFPLGLAGTIGMAFTKDTDANVRFQLDTININNDYRGQLSYSRTGGTTGWQVGWGRSIADRVYVGAAYKRLYRIVNSTKIVDLVNYNSGSTRDSVHLDLSGNAFRFGVMVPLGDLHIGLTSDIYQSAELKATGGVYRAIEDDPVAGSEESNTTDCVFPPTVTAGASYRFSKQWLAAGDFSLTKWDMFDAKPLIRDVDIDQTVAGSIGAQFIPAPDLLAPKYWETIYYRAGLRLAQLPDEGSFEFTGSIGAGFPLKGGGVIDFVLAYGNRSSDKYDDYREHTAQLGIGINGGRKWIRSSTETVY